MNRQKIKVVAVAEALGLLDPPKSKRKYWVHPLNTDREKIGQFMKVLKILDNILEYISLSITVCQFQVLMSC